MSEITRITMEHGSGGRATSELIENIFASAFNNEVLDKMEDAAVVPGAERIAITTDSFVVTPLEFPGGNIGRLSICGTVNDLLMRGAIPKYITCGFILEEGTDVDTLKHIVTTMAETACEAGIQIVAGDTKVIQGSGGIYINTTGVGVVHENVEISASRGEEGDVIIVSGNMGDHHATILSKRLDIRNSITSDAAPLCECVSNLLANNIKVHILRDVTRGGLATVLNELAESSGKQFEIEEDAIPVSKQVRDFCGLLGLNPLYMGNEGKLVAVVAAADADRALEIMRNSKYCEDSTVIGHVVSLPDSVIEGRLIMNTRIGGCRIVPILQGEGLPRLC